MRFIEIDCHCFERARTWPAAERRERHLSAFVRTVSREEAALQAILTGLLDPVDLDAVTRSVVAERIPEVMFYLVSDQLRRIGIQVDRPNHRHQR